MKKLHVLSNELIPLIEEEIADRDVSIVVSGSSMFPFYINQVTVVRLTQPNGVKKYDVILYKYHQKYILHRIIKINKDQLICRGDGLMTKEVIKPKDIIAVVMSHQDKGKTILSDQKGYIFKVKMWNMVFPIRRLLLKFIRR